MFYTIASDTKINNATMQVTTNNQSVFTVIYI